MTANAEGSDRGRAFGETLGFAVLAALLYWLTWQSALHGTDWRWFVLWLDEPGAVHPQHPGYLVVAGGIRWLLSPFEFDAYGVLRVLSIAGGSVAIAGVHRAARALSVDPWFARVVTALVLVSPALWHHATVVELHAPFLAVMAWASWMAVRWALEGSGRLALPTGVLTGAATLMHATGHLFVPVIAAAVAWRCRRRGWRWVIASISALLLAHAATWTGGFVGIRAAGSLPESVGAADPGNPADYLLEWWAKMDFFTQVGPTVLHEWLQSFAPMSGLVLVALFVPRWRAAAALLLAVLAIYLVATVALVHAWTDERGAYLLPLLFPAVALAVAVVPRMLWPMLAIAGLICGALFRGEPGRLPPDLAFGDAAAAMSREAPTVFFVADFPEMDGAFRADPRLDLMLARKEHDELQAAQAQTGPFEPTPEQIVGWLTLLTVQAKDEQARFVITDRAVAWLSQRVAAFDAGFALFEARIGVRRLPPAAGVAGYVVPR